MCESPASDGFKQWHEESKQMGRRRWNREQRPQAVLEEGKEPSSERGKDTQREVGGVGAHTLQEGVTWQNARELSILGR